MSFRKYGLEIEFVHAVNIYAFSPREKQNNPPPTHTSSFRISSVNFVGFIEFSHTRFVSRHNDVWDRTKLKHNFELIATMLTCLNTIVMQTKLVLMLLSKAMTK